MAPEKLKLSIIPQKQSFKVQIRHLASIKSLCAPFPGYYLTAKPRHYPTPHHIPRKFPIQYLNMGDEGKDTSRDVPKRPRSLFNKLLRGHGSETSSRPVTATDEESLKHSNNSSLDSLPPLLDLKLHGYGDCSRHKLMDLELAENIRLLLPPRLQLYDDWEMIYSLEQHGISLNTLYRNSSTEHQREKLKLKGRKKTELGSGYAGGVVKTMVTSGAASDASRARPHGYIMVIQDEKKNKFGCFLNEPLRALDHRRYYGNGECFLWKCEWFDKAKLGETHSEDPAKEQRFKAFMYTGINDNLIYSNNSYIAIGSSSGNNGLWIDKSLYQGVSYPCDTFGNEILNEHGSTGNKFGKFKIISLEMWRVGNLA